MDVVTALLVGVPAQVAVFALVPLAWWLQAGRPGGSFWRWLGFRRPSDGADQVVRVALVAAGLGFFVGAMLAQPGWTASAQGFVLVFVVAVTAVLQHALSEELFFRGFLLRCLADARRVGPALGNVLQASVCGLLKMASHWILVNRGLAGCLAVLALGAGAALLAGWVRLRTGSLLPGWAAHGAGLLVAGLIMAFR
ncbi:MAG: CPBP family intramembrane metalloprotease [Micropruina sp.]